MHYDEIIGYDMNHYAPDLIEEGLEERGLSTDGQRSEKIARLYHHAARESAAAELARVGTMSKAELKRRFPTRTDAFKAGYELAARQGDPAFLREGITTEEYANLVA